MKLSECTYGRIVAHQNTDLVGMIVGISQNSKLDPLVTVKWQTGCEYNVPADMLCLYED